MRNEAFGPFGRKCYGFIYPHKSRDSIRYFRQQCEFVSVERRERARMKSVHSHSACLRKTPVLKYELLLRIALSFKRTR